MNHLQNSGKTVTIALALAFAILIGALSSHIVRAASPADGPSPTGPQDAPPQDGPPPDQGNDGHRPPRPPRVEEILADLNLTSDQQQKVDALTADFQQKQRQLREDFLGKLKAVLTPEQFEKVRSAMDRNPPPPRRDQSDDDQAAPEQPGQNPPPATQPAASAADSPTGTVIFTGGYDLDPRDRGRPDVLIAAALNVPTDVFRTAFTGVTPASDGNAPEPAQVRLNKEALLKVLGPYGVTDDRLNAVSNHYRYRRSRGQMWPTTAARATAVITNGKVNSFTIDEPGCGYTSAPTITIVGFPDVHAAATIAFTTDFKTNGSIKEITLAK